MSSEVVLKQRIVSDLSLILPDASFYIFMSPLLVLLLGALTILLVGAFSKSSPLEPNKIAQGLGIGLAFCASFLAVMLPFSTPQAYLGSGVLLDGISRVGFSVISVGLLLTLLGAATSTWGRQLMRFELLALLLFSTCGLMIMVSAGEFMTFFIGLEITSISLYVLVGYQRPTIVSLEAAIKYFLMGAVAAAVILMGVALIYATTASLRFSDLAHLALGANLSPLAFIGLVLLLLGVSFKLALAPFHAWAPDVYQGAQSHLSGYMAGLVKFSVALVLIRLLSFADLQGFTSDMVATIFCILGVLSMVVGAVLGLAQNSVRRMLAYSSIANAGYLCLGFAVLASNSDVFQAKQAVMAYAVIYAILTLGTFMVLAWIEEGHQDDLHRSELVGLGYKHPWAAVALTVFLLGLSGLPPLAGFFGKFFLLLSALEGGFVWLAIIMVVLSCLPLAYYLSVVARMWFRVPHQHTPSFASTPLAARATLKVLTVFCVLLVLFLGVFGPRWALEMDYTQAVDLRPR